VYVLNPQRVLPAVSRSLFPVPYPRAAEGIRGQHQVAQRQAQFAFLCGFSVMVIEASSPGVFIGGQQHPVDLQPAPRGHGALNATRVVMHA
jgi:hypothetical protein